MKVILLQLIGIFLVLNCLQAQENDEDLRSVKSRFLDGNYDEAINESMAIINSETKDSIKLSLAYSYAGLSSQKLDKNADAIGYFKNAIIYRVPRLDIYEIMIGLASQENDDDNYEFGLLQQLKVFPDFAPEMRQKLASHYLKTDQYDKLLTTCDALIEIFPEDVKFYYYKGMAYQNLNEISDAEDAFKKALQKDEDHFGANINLGMILYKKASSSYKSQKAKYEVIKKPDRLDYDKYRKALDVSKGIYRESLPYLLKAYEIRSENSIKGALYNVYTRLEERDNAALYK